MEGKSILFKEFADVDAFPIVLDTKDVNEIVETVVRIAPTLGGINLEDISAPRCFEIEKKLKERLNIPVFHDDQHGTAIIVLSGLMNALKIVNKKVEDLQSRLNTELSKNESLAKSNAELSKNLEDYSKIILENKQLTEQLNNLNKNKLIESKKIEQEKSLQENKIKELQQKITLLEQQAKKTENIEDRFSKLAFDPIGNIKVVAENFKRNDLSQEDIDLYNALTNK